MLLKRGLRETQINFVVSIQHFMLSNIADTVNKHKMAMAGIIIFKIIFEIFTFHFQMTISKMKISLKPYEK